MEGRKKKKQGTESDDLKKYDRREMLADQLPAVNDQETRNRSVIGAGDTT